MASEPEILTYAQDDLPAGLRDQVLALHRQAWPPAGLERAAGRRTIRRCARSR
jgi:hypothetical protein